MQNKRVSICLNALLLQNHLGGIGNYAHQLAQKLVETHPEWDFSLLIHKGVAGYFRDIPKLRILEINVSSRLGRLAFLHLVFPFMVRRYSLLHSVGNMGLIFCMTPQIITLHDTYECSSPERFSWIKRQLMRFLISISGWKADRIITDSNNSFKVIRKYYPHLASKTSVVYLGNRFPVQTIPSVDNRRDFLFVGTVEPGKNLALVLEAFSRFHHLHEGQLKVVGAMGWKQSHLPALIETLEISDAVEFLGYASNEKLEELYARSLALIQASTYEGFGLPVIEAMACGCPVIAAYNSGLIEAGGESALFFKTNDKEDLLLQMELIYKDSEVRKQCIQSGLSHAAQFTWEKTASETAKVYESLLMNTRHY